MAKSLDVSGRVDVVAQSFDGDPDRHVDDDEGVVVAGELGGVSRSRLQAPDKTGSRIRQSVDGIELGDKPALWGSSRDATRRPVLIGARWKFMTALR